MIPVIALFFLVSFPFLSTDDKGNFLIQWLSRADPDFPAPKISSSKRPLSSGQVAACMASIPVCHLAFSLALWLCYTLPWLLLLSLSGACCLSLPFLLLLFKEFRGLFLPGSATLTAHLGSEPVRSLKVRGHGVTSSEEGCWKVRSTFFVGKVASSVGFIRESSLVIS